MLLNPRRSGYAALLVGLFLVTSGVGCASPTSSAPDVTQPALPASPTISISTVPHVTRSLEVLAPAPISMVPLATRTLDLLESTPISMIPLATSTPKALNPASNDAGTALDIASHRPVDESLDSAQPGDDRTPTRLVIQAIGLDAPVEPVGWHIETQNSRSVDVWDVPGHFAAGWFKTSAPLGVPGNTVMDGHHNMEGKVFENLINIHVGDIIVLYAANIKRVYRVDQKLIVKELGQPLEVIQANAKYIEPTADERLTLVTCWPATGNSHRLIIIALPFSLSPH
jgi:LPXTG-site transpeptidase (sortase) family protein